MPLVVGVGRLTAQKNFARFIDVIAKVRRSLPVRAVIAGQDFGCRDDLERQIARLGLQAEVQLIGTVPDARELMCAADILLLTSDFEGMPNVVLEAMAAAKPCVVTNVHGVDDLIESGANGFRSSCDVSELAGYVVRLAADPHLRSAMGQAACLTVENYKPDRIARTLWAVCDEEG
jgi:glycosyltransferase involved in cell wall biosynthesis